MAQEFNLQTIDWRGDAAEDALRMAILLSGLSEFISEFQLIDPADLIAFAQYDNFSNIADLVASSAELSFKPGKLTFGWGARVDIAWRRPPELILDLEFSHDGVTVFFGLRLGSFVPTLDLRMISFGDQNISENSKTLRLLQAIAGARSSCDTIGPIAERSVSSKH